MLAKESGESNQKFAAKIAAETESLARIVTEFLEFARPHGMSRQIVDLRPVLEDCAQEAGVGPQLSGTPHMRGSGDSVLVRQDISNLLRNSADTARNGARVKVSLSGSLRGDKLQAS